MSTPPHETFSTPTRLIVHGAAGRMGSRLCQLALADPAFALVARADARADADESRRDPAAPPTQKTLEIKASAHVVIDFSSDRGARDALDLAARCGAALLVGTTGLSAPTVDALRAASAARAVLVAPNTSLGVAVLARLAADAARALGPAYECSIVEAHHSRKKDAPSGTALRLASALRQAGADVRDDQILSIRAGDVVGEHTIRLAGPGEYIELAHRATSRDLFVLGALRAAQWLRRQPAGWWSMEDALGLGAV